MRVSSTFPSAPTPPLSAFLHQLFIFKPWQQQRWKIPYWKDGLVKAGERFVLEHSWREGGGLRGMALMKVTFITLSLDKNLCVGHLLDWFWYLMCVQGVKIIWALQSIRRCWLGTGSSRSTWAGTSQEWREAPKAFSPWQDLHCQSHMVKNHKENLSQYHKN